MLKHKKGTETQKSGYPQKPITLVVPYAAGGGTDTGNRILAKYAEKHLGQPIVIQNVEGGGGEIGFSQMLRSKPDGYTIGAATLGHITLTVMRTASYDIVKDVQPVSLIVSDPTTLVIRADDSRFSSIEDIVKYAKENPNKFTVGTSGAGSSDHFSLLALSKAAGVQMKPVHFGGASEAKAAFLGGHVDAFLPSYGEAKQLLTDKKIKMIAVATDERFEEIKDVPTFKEKGLNVLNSSIRGLAAPKGTPKEVLEKLADSFKKATEDPGFKEEMQGKDGLTRKVSRY